MARKKKIKNKINQNKKYELEMNLSTWGREAQAITNKKIRILFFFMIAKDVNVQYFFLNWNYLYVLKKDRNTFIDKTKSTSIILKYSKSNISEKGKGSRNKERQSVVGRRGKNRIKKIKYKRERKRNQIKPNKEK